MNRRSLRTSAGLGLGMLVLPGASFAADLPLKAPALKAVYDWTGLYIGAHAGYSRGSSSFVLSDPAATVGSGQFSGMIGGVQASYNYRLASGLRIPTKSPRRTDMKSPVDSETMSPTFPI